MPLNRNSRERNVGQISGFLSGVCALNGGIGEYEGFAYSFELEDENPDVAGLINEYFRGQHEFSFTSTELLEGGLGELERRLALHMLPDFHFGNEDTPSDRGRHLAFRLIEMIYHAFGEFPLGANVTQLRDTSTPDECTFFSIVSGNLLLVLQFNKYSR